MFSKFEWDCVCFQVIFREDSHYDNEASRPRSRQQQQQQQQQPNGGYARNGDHVNVMTPNGPRIREKKYGNLEAAAAMRQGAPNRTRGDSINSRYSSDPCRLLESVREKGVCCGNHVPLVYFAIELGMFIIQLGRSS